MLRWFNGKAFSKPNIEGESLGIKCFTAKIVLFVLQPTRKRRRITQIHNKTPKRSCYYVQDETEMYVKCWMTKRTFYDRKEEGMEKFYWSEIETIKPVTQIPFLSPAVRQIFELLKGSENCMKSGITSQWKDERENQFNETHNSDSHDISWGL